MAHARMCATSRSSDREGPTVASAVALLYEIHFVIIFHFTKRAFMFSNTVPSPRASPSHGLFFTAISRAYFWRRFCGKLRYPSVRSRSALRLCCASRTDERGRNGRGSPASERGSQRIAFIYARVHARASRRVTWDTLRR